VNRFEAFDARMHKSLEALLGDASEGSSPEAGLPYTPFLAQPSANPIPDPNRAPQVLPASIISLSHARVNIGDNGLGRASGRFNLSPAVNLVSIAFGKEHLPWRPRRFDQIGIDDTTWSVTEVMDDGGAGWALRLTRL
jgi:hypothetical protein